MSEFLTIDHFKPLVGRPFEVVDTPFVLTLDRIDSNGKPLIPGAQRIAFNLIFAGPPQIVLRPGTYGFRCGKGPVWPIHVAPMHTLTAGRQEYQAMFD